MFNNNKPNREFQSGLNTEERRRSRQKDRLRLRRADKENRLQKKRQTLTNRGSKYGDKTQQQQNMNNVMSQQLPQFVQGCYSDHAAEPTLSKFAPKNKFAPKSTFAPKSNFKIHIGIDFGTDGVALSYSLANSKEVYVHTTWSNTKYKAENKPKTIILLDEKYKPIGFGKDAKWKYIMSPENKDKWLLFERFKMSLYDNEGVRSECKDNNDEKKINIKDELIAANGQSVKSSIVFIAAFKYLQKQATNYLKRNKITKGLYKQVKKCDIQWIITVPAIWNDEAKFRMREWIIKAGLVSKHIYNQCKIVYEPDCASLAVQHQIHKQKSQIVCNFIDDVQHKEEDKKMDDAQFINGEKYILVDAGGGTVDIACHEILGDINKFAVKEILSPSGGPWGSCYIDDKYIILLKEMFGEKLINEFKRKDPAYYVNLIHNFQAAKEEFYKDPQKTSYNVETPMEFIGFIQDKLDEKMMNDSQDVEDIVSAYSILKYGEDTIELEDEYLKINVIVWKSMFNQVINPTIQHIKKLLSKPQLKGKCNYLCLVGGLSKSLYFQYRMKEEFGPQSPYKLSIIIPLRPLLTVVEGAAYFAITENMDYIKSRILRYSYGEIVQLTESKAISRGIPKECIEKNKIWDVSEKQWWVHDCFDVLARKNEEIKVGDVRLSVGERSNANQLKMNVRMAWSNSNDPKVRTDGTNLGIVEVEFPNKDKDDMRATLEFHFAETMITAVVRRDKDPQHTEVRYITNWM